MLTERPLCPSCGAEWLRSPFQREGCANGGCDLRIRLPHISVDGEEWMPAGWCGGCDTCAGYPVVKVCLACTYSPKPDRPMLTALFPGAPPESPQEPVLFENCPTPYRETAFERMLRSSEQAARAMNRLKTRMHRVDDVTHPPF